MPRYSPERHHPEKLSKHGQDKFKQVRPAYEPTVHASNQAMYSGGYRPNNRETVQYSKQGMRQPEPKISPWQREREDPAGPMKKQDEATVDAKRTITPQRKSRSPVRRDRSPLRDRYKRHSPSPRSSHSPRRSWALEKRRSPEIRDAPPPPSWPGQNIRDAEYPRTRPNFPEREAEKPKHVPVWEPRAIDDEPRSRRPDIHEGRRPEIPERRPFIEEKIRPVKELLVRDPVPHPVHREPKFTHREEYDADRRDNYRRRESSVERKPHPHREEYDPVRMARDHEERLQPDEYHRRRESSPRHDSRKELVNSAIDKDFEDYKRAIQKKAEEMRSKRRDDYLEQEGSRSHHSERERDERPQRYEERHRFREEELRAREREERPREDRSRDDRPRDDAPHREYRREDYPKEKQEERVEDTRLKRIIDPSIRIKRDKAIEEISNKILDRHEHYKQLQGEQRNRVLEELKLAIARIVFDMFGDSDVSFIEIIIKYQAKYDLKQEEKILQEVTASLPSPFRVIKRHAPEMSEVPAKTRRSKSPHIVPEHAPRPKLSESKKKPVLQPKKQRPPQSLKRRAEPLIPESTKTSPKEAKVDKAPVKTPGVKENSSGSSSKPEPKKQEEVKKPAPPPAPVEPPLKGGHYELNARMTKMVETELRDIMIKVWNELPNNPSDEAEAHVVDKLRNQAGDFLRNVLGLNITKRLLNVHNPLYVKVQFSGKPEKVHLGEFLKKYNFTAFKRIEKTVNMFAAQVKTINDFDKICSESDVRCGDIKVSVMPIYNFTKCPPNLVISFSDLDWKVSDETADTTEKEEKPDTVIKPEKVLAKTENTTVTTKPKEDAKTNTTKDKVVNKAVDNKTAVNKPAPAAVSKPEVNKAAVKPATEIKTTPNKTTVENKATANKPAVNDTVNKTPVKPAAEKPAASKPTPEKAISKPAAQNKTVTKPTADVKESPKAAAVNKTAVANKTAAEIKEVKKPQVASKTNDSGKKPASSPAKATDKTSKVDDFDELDDHDILALMSEGIVLDECSGSDEE